MPSTNLHVCVPCRVVHRAPGVCPVCRGPLISASPKWRPPRKDNEIAWARIARGQWLWDGHAVRRAAARARRGRSWSIETPGLKDVSARWPKLHMQRQGHRLVVHFPPDHGIDDPAGLVRALHRLPGIHELSLHEPPLEVLEVAVAVGAKVWATFRRRQGQPPAKGVSPTYRRASC